MVPVLLHEYGSGEVRWQMEPAYIISVSNETISSPCVFSPLQLAPQWRLSIAPGFLSLDNRTVCVSACRFRRQGPFRQPAERWLALSNSWKTIGASLRSRSRQLCFSMLFQLVVVIICYLTTPCSWQRWLASPPILPILGTGTAYHVPVNLQPVGDHFEQ